jgi:peptidoglycan hydrolase-like protein with peptidoglycan-binding domain
MRRRALAGLLVTAAAAGLVGAGALATASLAGTPGGSTPSATPLRANTALVTRKTLQVQASLSGTLGYAGSIAISSGLSGTLTWTPEPGSVIARGGELYEVDGSRKAILMYGERPEWRTLSFGAPNGKDVEQLETNLRALGYAPAGMAINEHWDRMTTAAVKRWQLAAGLVADGVVDFGEVVFLPEPFRVTDALPLGTSGGEVLQGTTDRRIVAVSLDATRRSLLSVGQNVSVYLPDGSTAPGHVGEIGKVAHSSGGDGAGVGTGSGSATLDVTISLDDEAAAPDLDQAPVVVRVVTSSRPNVLAVPVNSLVALVEGGYALEVVGADGAAQYVSVQLGLFDSGWVEIVSGEVHEGDRVVVPS